MRIAEFELNCAFRRQFTLAEVINGRAAVLQLLRIRNVRGSGTSWLQLLLELDGKRVRQKSIRNLPVGDEDGAAALERSICQDMVLQVNTPAGEHTLRLLITGENASAELVETISVLTPDIIPTDFVRAGLLSAYVRLSDSLRCFAAEAAGHLAASDPAAAARCLYEALKEKQLLYQPVSGRQYPDCQRLSGMESILQHGGSCADLSLLFASLMWNIDVPPALLLFEDHLAAGCFTGGLPLFETMNDPAGILRLVQEGELLPWEATSICRLYQHPFDAAKEEILRRIRLCAEKGRPCMLINVQRMLMQGLKTVPEDLLRRQCRCCGYTAEFTVRDPSPRCPACGAEIPPLQLPDPSPVPEMVVYSDEVVYARHAGHAAAVRLKKDTDALRLMDTWQGLAVTEIGERAFEGAGVKSVALPEGIAAIGDYAFARCAGLKRFVIPDTVTRMGAGALMNSGLESVCIPGSIGVVPRLAFAGCAGLEYLTLSEGIARIDEKAFDGCLKLREVTIPASVRQVARNAFPEGCRLIFKTSSVKWL